MATTVTIAGNGTSVTVRSTDFDQKTILAALKTLGKRLQKAIANNFQNQKTVDGELKANKSDYDVRKILRGGSPLRGHDTGRLQKALESVKSWDVGRTKNGGVLAFSDHHIWVAVPYSIHYTRKKTKGKRIMAIPARWLADIKAALKAILKGEKRLPQRAIKRNPSRNAARIAGLAARATRRQQRTTVEVG